MKKCYSCNNKPTKNGVYKSNIEKFIFEQLPNNNSHYHKKGTSSRIIEKLKPNTCIFYFATMNKSFTTPLKNFKDAYDKLENSGVTRTDSNGNAKFFLDCPQVYISLDGKVYDRHIHYLYWDEKYRIWNKNLYTQSIICDIDQKFVLQNMKKCLLIDTLPSKMYKNKHIKGAYNIPFNKKINENDLEKNIFEKFNNKSKNIIIIVYCYNANCIAAIKVLKKLNKLGYNNVVHYKDGIESWNGPIE